MTDDPPGLLLGPLRTWLDDQGLGPRGDLTATLLEGGRSNLTYLVRDTAGTSWVVRRPPLGHVMPSAHDMGREYRVMSGLNRVDFPTPRAWGLCSDEEVIGSSFLVMEYVAGRVIDSPDAAAAMDEPARGEASAALIDTLATLHRVDPAAAGLEELGRPAGYLTRQVERWGRQWELSQTRDLPTVEQLGRELQHRVAEAEASATVHSIVHGDYRIDNAILGIDDAQVQAVLDWEMATLGDPVADLAVTLVYWTDPGDGRRASVPVSENITDQPGFWTRGRLVERYAEQTGFALDHLDFCAALACFKLAIIMESIRYRALAGQQLGTAARDVDAMGQATEALTDLGMQVLARGTIEGLRQ